MIPLTESDDLTFEHATPFHIRKDTSKNKEGLSFPAPYKKANLVSSKFIYAVNCINPRPSHLGGDLADRHRPIRHTEVRCNRPLTTNTSSSSSLGTSQAGENAHLQDTGNVLDLPRKLTHLPSAILTGNLASLDIGLGEHGWEGRVNEEEALIGLQRTLLYVQVLAEDRLDGAEFIQLADNAVGGDGSDFDGDVFPV